MGDRTLLPVEISAGRLWRKPCPLLFVWKKLLLRMSKSFSRNQVTPSIDLTLQPAFPLDLAIRASNISERMGIVKALREMVHFQLPDGELNDFEQWKINTLVTKFVDQSLKEAFFTGTPTDITQESLLDVLTTHKQLEANVSHLDKQGRELIAEIHNAWLPTYQNTMQAFDTLVDKSLVAVWYQPEIYYGRLAKACEPFLVYLSQNLNRVRMQANISLGVEMFAHQLVEDFLHHLLNRFELVLAWAIEVDANVYCARNGIEKGLATTEDYVEYLNTTFQDGESYHRFYIKFPTLGRWLAHITAFLVKNGTMLIERLATDVTEISQTLLGKEIVAIRSFQPGRSDYHAGGQSVVFVHVELADAEQGTFVYKPRSLQSELALNGLLKLLASDGVIGFATHRILSKQDYGYAALIPSGRNHVDSPEKVALIYQELGGYLALFHVLGGGDLHHENLLIADGHAFICDGETVLGVLPPGQERPLDTVLDSVFKTGLLEWPSLSDADTAMRISGYAGGESFQLPFAQPRVNGRRLSFAVSVRNETGIQIDPDTTNRVYLNGQLVQPEDFREQILDGFSLVHEWFRQNQARAIACVSEQFEGALVRFISWGTQIYAQLLMAVRHPSCLMEPLEVDLVFNNLREHTRKWDQQGHMAACELSSLWQLDVPIFTVGVQDQTLIYGHHTSLPVTLQLTPLAFVAERINRLSSENRFRQLQYITASLSVREVHNASFVASAMDYAQQIGWQICRLQSAPSESVPWKSYQITQDGLREIDILADLYNGTAGIALFLAYLDAHAPQAAFRQAAERALAYTIAHCDRNVIGAFQGLGGLIYLLTHLYRLWQQPELLTLAVELSDELATHIEEDETFEVLDGVAGVIPVMIGLAEVTSDKVLGHAHRCAKHLLRNAVRQEGRLSWPLKRPEEAHANLTGFSHGAGGIGWALISLGSLTFRSDYIEAGRQAFAYEAMYFDKDEQDWYDLRTQGVAANKNGLHFANAWCNGAAGIGLSRIASWAMLGKNDEEMLKEARIALAATLRNFHQLGNDTLCHGKAGNAEFFLRFARLKDEPAFHMEANVQAQAQWRNFEEAQNWTFGGIGIDVFPGLMVGLAGTGLHFLRLAYPDQIPSPLLLDAPPYHTTTTTNKEI